MDPMGGNGNIIVVLDDNDTNDDIWGDENTENNVYNNNNNAPNPNPTNVDEEEEEDNGGFEVQGMGDDNSRLLREMRRLDGFTNPEATAYAKRYSLRTNWDQMHM
jgi:hypothetical protein